MPQRESSSLDVLLAQDRDDEDHDENERDRIEHVDEPHHQVVDPAADVPGHGAVGDADEQRDQRGHDADDERNPRAPEHARQQIAAEFVAAAIEPSDHSPNRWCRSRTIQRLRPLRFGITDLPVGMLHDVVELVLFAFDELARRRRASCYRQTKYSEATPICAVAAASSSRTFRNSSGVRSMAGQSMLNVCSNSGEMRGG